MLILKKKKKARQSLVELPVSKAPLLYEGVFDERGKPPYKKKTISEKTIKVNIPQHNPQLPPHYFMVSNQESNPHQWTSALTPKPTFPF